MATYTVGKDGKRIITDILVCGYSRQAADEYNMTIPKEIIRLCFIFWFIPVCDEWSKELSYSGYDIDGANAKLDTSDNEDGLLTLFGIHRITKGIFEWKIKFKSNIDWICIGVIVDDAKALEENKKNNNYGFHQDMGCFLLNLNGKMYYGGTRYAQYAKPFEMKDTVITMTLNMDKHSISYKIDDKDYGVGFRGLRKDKYRLAVTAGTKGDEIELL